MTPTTIIETRKLFEIVSQKRYMRRKVRMSKIEKETKLLTLHTTVQWGPRLEGI